MHSCHVIFNSDSRCKNRTFESEDRIFLIVLVENPEKIRTRVRRKKTINTIKIINIRKKRFQRCDLQRPYRNT